MFFFIWSFFAVIPTEWTCYLLCANLHEHKNHSIQYVTDCMYSLHYTLFFVVLFYFDQFSCSCFFTSYKCPSIYGSKLVMNIFLWNCAWLLCFTPCLILHVIADHSLPWFNRNWSQFNCSDAYKCFT